MKKIILLISFLFVTTLIYAQSAKLGIKAGVNFSSLSANYNGQTTSTSISTGFQAGAVLDVSLAGLSLEPGILFSLKGGKQSNTSGVTSGSIVYSSSSTEELRLNYIEVPVNILYNIPVVVGKVFFGGGPYVGYGISGKDTYSTTGPGNNISGSQDISFGGTGANFKNPDFGINVLAGFKSKGGIAVSAGYGFGLSNLSNQSGYTTNNRVASLTLGYYFL